jgi:hypothetical protein
MDYHTLNAAVESLLQAVKYSNPEHEPAMRKLAQHAKINWKGNPEGAVQQIVGAYFDGLAWGNWPR